MFEAITQFVEGLMGSPWIYLALFGLAALDAVIPMVPSETLVISAGVFAAASGEPNFYGVVAAAATGAFVGDQIAYSIGARVGSSVRRAPAGSRRRRIVDHGGALLRARGAPVLIACRFIPGARTAVTLTAGVTRYPRGLFSAFDAFGAFAWGMYGALVGSLGGTAFEDQPLLGVAVGLALALVLATVGELVRHVRARRRRGRSDDDVRSAPQRTRTARPASPPRGATFETPARAALNAAAPSQARA